jgi:hypothetical protein
MQCTTYEALRFEHFTNAAKGHRMSQVLNAIQVVQFIHETTPHRSAVSTGFDPTMLRVDYVQPFLSMYLHTKRMRGPCDL